jgi:Flp pilus assembly protein CpaB
VLVATHNLENGALIKEADVRMADWGGPVPMGAILKPEDATKYLASKLVSANLPAETSQALVAALGFVLHSVPLLFLAKQ